MYNPKKNRVIKREQKIFEEDMQSISNIMMYQCQESVMIQPNLNLPITFLIIKYATWTLNLLFCNTILYIQLPKFYYIVFRSNTHRRKCNIYYLIRDTKTQSTKLHVDILLTAKADYYANFFFWLVIH